MDIVKFVHNNFKDKNLLATFLISFLSFVLVLGILAGLLFYYRSAVFGYFAKEYLMGATSNEEESTEEVVNITEKIIEKQSIFTQEYFVVDAVKKTSPSVVSIVISKEIPKYEVYSNPKDQQQDIFGNIFPGFVIPSIPQYRQNGVEKKDVGGGSGFFVSSDGLIVTNRHVVEDTGAFYTVFTNDGKKHEAKVVARDPVLDIALIKINGNNFPTLPLGNSDSVLVGQTAIAIGNALSEFRNTVSVGVVSGLSRSVTAGGSFGKSELLDNVIQTDAAINPGNSGGPLLDLSGKVIGVNVAVVTGSQGIGFALPINSIKSAIESVKTSGKIVRPYLGVRYLTVNSEIQKANDLSVDYGAIVKAGASASELAVIPGSPADKVGIVENDIILAIDGAKISESHSLAAIIRQKKIGQVVSLHILHKGADKYLQATLEAAKDN